MCCRRGRPPPGVLRRRARPKPCSRRPYRRRRCARAPSRHPVVVFLNFVLTVVVIVVVAGGAGSFIGKMQFDRPGGLDQAAHGQRRARHRPRRDRRSTAEGGRDLEQVAVHRRRVAEQAAERPQGRRVPDPGPCQHARDHGRDRERQAVIHYDLHSRGPDQRADRRPDQRQSRILVGDCRRAAAGREPASRDLQVHPRRHPRRAHHADAARARQGARPTSGRGGPPTCRSRPGPTRDARLDRREGDRDRRRAARVAAVFINRLAPEHAAAVGPDGRLRPVRRRRANRPAMCSARPISRPSRPTNLHRHGLPPGADRQSRPRFAGGRRQSVADPRPVSSSPTAPAVTPLPRPTRSTAERRALARRSNGGAGGAAPAATPDADADAPPTRPGRRRSATPRREAGAEAGEALGRRCRPAAA